MSDNVVQERAPKMVARPVIRGDGATAGELRCQCNPFETLLFRYDWRGIWVYCRDCRNEEDKRGAEHLVTWRLLFLMFLGLGGEEQ